MYFFFIGFNIKILAKQKCLIKGNLAKILFINSLNNGILKGKIIIFFCASSSYSDKKHKL